MPARNPAEPLDARMLKDVRELIQPEAWPILVKHAEEQGYTIDTCPYRLAESFAYEELTQLGIRA